MERGKYLAKNTSIIGIGSVISKITQFIVLSLCTYKLSSSEYGIADICVSTAALLLPVFSLDIYDAVFRFVMEKNKPEKGIITFAFLVIIFGGIVALFFTPLANLIPKIGGYWITIVVLSFLEALQLLVKEYARGKEEGKTYVIGGIINSITQIASCLLFVYLFDFRIIGYIISLCLGYSFEFIYIFFKLKLGRKFDVGSIAKSETKGMLSYSLPLIPNTIMWWIVSISDRYFILYMIDESATGLYSVAAKVPALITVITSIFFKAWQMSAIEVEKNSDKNEYSSKVFNYLWLLGALSIAGVLVLLRIILTILVSTEYQVAWRYATVLIVAAGFSSLQSFIGTAYTVQMDSVGCLRSTSFMAVINIILNYLLIKLMGVQGATIATLISYIFVTVYRFFDTRKYLRLNFDYYKMIITYLILVLESIIAPYFDSLFYPITLGSLILICFLNKQMINDVIFSLSKITTLRMRRKEQ